VARPQRADARRNYDLLLAAGEEAFTEHGPDASLEDIAPRAGVGIGTLYRHFPGRQALLEAAYLDRQVDRLISLMLTGIGAASRSDP
jgi:AcrR family transcriptional regulator